MNKEALGLAVETTEDGLIRIVQPDALAEQALAVVLHPEQVDLLIKWLHEAKDELVDK